MPLRTKLQQELFLPTQKMQSCRSPHQGVKLFQELLVKTCTLEANRLRPNTLSGKKLHSLPLKPMIDSLGPLLGSYHQGPADYRIHEIRIFKGLQPQGRGVTAGFWFLVDSMPTRLQNKKPCLKQVKRDIFTCFSPK